MLCAGEIYKDRTGCENAVESVKRIAADSPVMEEVSDGEKYIAYTPVSLADADRAKRLLRDWVRFNEGLLLPDMDYVFVARHAILDATRDDGRDAMARALGQLKKNPNSPDAE